MVETTRRRLGRALTGAVVLVLALVVVPTTTRATDFATLEAQGASALLEYADRLMNHHVTQVWLMEMTVKPRSGDAKMMKFRVWQKDQTKRLVRFVEPGDVKGLSMLSTGKVMYVYSTETDNARRIAAHARRQTLLGSGLTYEDMASIDLSQDYEATFDGGAAVDGVRWLWLTRKEGSEASWPKLHVGIGEKTSMPDVVEYYDGDKLERVQRRYNYGVLKPAWVKARDGLDHPGGIPTFTSVSITDLESGLVTTLDVLEQEIGKDLPDKMFKKRYLIRGR